MTDPTQPTSQRTPHRRRSAFTLIELLLVLVILGILTAVVATKFSGRSESARNTAARTDISQMDTALDAFEVDNGRYPTTDEGLKHLTTPIPNAKDPTKWPYLKRPVGNDPWGRPYQYRNPGQNNTNGYDLFSMGPDGQEGGTDDITNWQQQ